jgi:hypothetical protein
MLERVGVAGLLFGVALGCSTPCPPTVGVAADSTSTAAMTLTESQAEATTNPAESPPPDPGSSSYPSQLDDAGPDGAVIVSCGAGNRNIGTATAPRCVFSLSTIETAPFEPAARCSRSGTGSTQGAATEGACVVVSLGATQSTLFFSSPAAPGNYRLEDLGATLCDAACSPLAGSLVVSLVAAPCGNRGCGRFEADLTIAASAAPLSDAPSISGTAHLHYAEQAAQCGGGHPVELE